MILNVNVPDTLEARQALYGRYCPALHESVVCSKQAMEGVAMCTKGNISLTVLMEKKIVHNLIDLICKNNGQFMLGMFNKSNLVIFSKCNPCPKYI